ncbi:MAG: hypothetical protein KF760_16565 [Candidatus Eremiobacteraeota bacterium]|nr:hypothetical protein [Candidatus Eremiobacteraeota bacterium]MCW5867614.1 hypothetical protein [Candidatus Eremiobacteraeota bacterium]
MADNPYLSSLVEAWGGDDSALPDIETDPFPDETLSPGMSEFIRIARRYTAGVVDDHGFVDSIQDVANRLQVYLALHQQLLHSLPLTFPQAALGSLSTQALLSFSEGLSEMVSCFSQGDLPRVGQGIERCKQAIIILEAWWIELCRVVRHETSRVCNQCGAVTPPGQAECSGCQAPLGEVSDEFQVDQEFYEVAEPWLQLYRDTRKLVAGEMPLGDWSVRIDQLRSQVVEIQGRLRDIPRWEEQEQWLPRELVEAYEQVFGGLQNLRQALEMLQSYTQNRQVSALNQGWFLLVAGLRMLARPCEDFRYELLTLLEDLEADLDYQVE